MQYDENAEKYGYEGEMTPLKCDKLNAYKGDVTIPVYGTIADAEVYLKKDVDAAIEELKTALNESEEARYEAGADAADYYQENRRLRRSLWIARAEWARSSALSYHLIESHPDKDVAATYKRKANKWEKALGKFLKKAEEYK